MPNLQDVRDAKDLFTAKSSDISRQLALAALAIVWLFKIDVPGGTVSLSRQLLWPSLFAIGSLASDLIQYVYASIAWSVYNRVKERQLKNSDKKFDYPPLINWPTNLFFYLKIILVAACYCLLFRHLLRTLFN